MLDWLRRNAEMVGAVSGLVTAIATVVAVIVIPMQIAAADRIQRGQTAREIYREFLNMTIQKPELATVNWCAVSDARERVAYEAYVDYLLYTAEQAISTSRDWRGPMSEHLEDHMPFLCARADWSHYSDDVADLVTDLRRQCPKKPAC
ncbi:MAG: hypothetical protein JNM13_02730 [Hyphomicrobiaceae bacterium]|nr:hypothetical protein [Hyphomicrobiaceae bacterium]